MCSNVEYIYLIWDISTVILIHVPVSGLARTEIQPALNITANAPHKLGLKNAPAWPSKLDSLGHNRSCLLEKRATLLFSSSPPVLAHSSTCSICHRDILNNVTSDRDTLIVQRSHSLLHCSSAELVDTEIHIEKTHRVISLK